MYAIDIDKNAPATPNNTANIIKNIIFEVFSIIHVKDNSFIFKLPCKTPLFHEINEEDIMANPTAIYMLISMVE